MIMMAAKHINSTQAILIAALSTLSPPHLSLLTHSISSLFHHHRRRLSALLSSPILFSLALRRLRSLSLRQKSLLIARHLHSNLALLKHLTQNPTAPPPPAAYMKLQDLDAALLILLICEIHQHDADFLHAPPSQWRVNLIYYFSGSILSISRFGDFSNTEILIEYIESVCRCWNFVSLMDFRKNEGGEVAAATEVVVALPSVEVGGGECVICTEEMRKGREVCEMPCGHLFHWICILEWLKKTNTCPCCRRSLPTNDVHREIERLMEEFAKVGGGDWECGGRLYREYP